VRFYEFEAKKLLEKQGVPLPKSGTATTPREAKRLAADLGCPVVLKSQVLSGGRMKAGGVKFADTPEAAAKHAEAILKLEIKGQKPRNVLVERKAPVQKEYYAGVIFDGARKLPVIIFSDMGGIDIEEVAETHPDHISKTHFPRSSPSPTTSPARPSRSSGSPAPS
jgi:succinyl-CoA synthetase beta subunit